MPAPAQETDEAEYAAKQQQRAWEGRVDDIGADVADILRHPIDV
jgi:hypothetical protein